MLLFLLGCVHDVRTVVVPDVTAVAPGDVYVVADVKHLRPPSDAHVVLRCIETMDPQAWIEQCHRVVTFNDIGDIVDATRVGGTVAIQTPRSPSTVIATPGP